MLVIAGDRDQPAGDFRSSIEVIDGGAPAAPRHHRDRHRRLSGRPSAHLAAGSRPRARRQDRGRGNDRAGRPYRHAVLLRAAGDPAWIARLRGFGLEHPVRIGLAGPTSLSTLLRYAQRCGVRASAQGLARQTGLMRQLFAMSAPDALVRPLAQARAEGQLGEVAPHFFSFGGLARRRAGPMRWPAPHHARAGRRVSGRAAATRRFDPAWPLSHCRRASSRSGREQVADIGAGDRARRADATARRFHRRRNRSCRGRSRRRRAAAGSGSRPAWRQGGRPDHPRRAPRRAARARPLRRAARLKRVTCGRMIAWVSACGRPRPPSTWASLCCSPVPAASTMPASQAATRHSPRASRSDAVRDHARQMRGQAARRFDREAMLTGVRSGTDRPPTQWASAFSPLAALTAARQRKREIRVVDDRARQHPVVPAGELPLALAGAPDRRRFGSRIGRRHRQDRQAQIAGDDLGEPDGGAAAGRDQTVGPGGARRRETRIRHRLRHMDDRLRVQAGGARAQQLDEPPAEPRPAARRRDHQRAARGRAAPPRPATRASAPARRPRAVRRHHE